MGAFSQKIALLLLRAEKTKKEQYSFMVKKDVAVAVLGYNAVGIISIRFHGQFFNMTLI